MDLRAIDPRLISRYLRDSANQLSLNPDPSANMQGQPFPADMQTPPASVGSLFSGDVGKAEALLRQKEAERRRFLAQPD